MCQQALIDCVGRLRMAIVAYAELIGTLEAGPERDQIQEFAAVLAGQHQVLQRLCVGRCGPARCSAPDAPARDLG
jgi:hypothetical protein